MPLTNNTNASSLYAYNGTSFDRVQMNTSGQLQVEVKNTAPIDVSASFTTDISGQYVNVSNFPATQAVSATSLPLPTNASTDTLQSAGNSLLSSIDANITACNTGAVVISSGSLTETNSADIETNTLAISSKLPASLGAKTSANSMSVVLASDQVDLNVKQNDVVNQGSENNVASNETINSGATSSSNADISNMRKATLVYNDTATSSVDGLDVQMSGDGTNYHLVSTLYPNNNSAGTKRESYVSLNCGGYTHLRVVNNSTVDNYTNCNCSIYGSP